MNKYQESLNHISELAAWTRSDSDVSPHKDLLQELVDKETPMKQEDLSSEDVGSYLVKMTHLCVNCQECYLTASDKYCSECGQKIDWSNE